MATMTNQQIEQKKAEGQLVEAGAIELSDDDLGQAAGGAIPSVLQNIPTAFTPVL